MPATTGSQLVKTALQLLLVLDPEDNLSAAQGATGLRALRLMMENEFQLPMFATPVTAREVFDLVANQGGPDNPYTIGEGGDFDTTRPIELTGAGLILGNTDPAIEMPRAVITDDGWQNIQIKGLTNALFTEVYYNPTYTDDLGTINLWPVPNTAVNQLVLYRPMQLSSFSSLNASVQLPIGSEAAIQYRLATWIASLYGKQIPPKVEQIANSTYGRYMRSNHHLVDIQQDPAITNTRRGGYNINSGTAGGA
jgi:hypothetical protein